MREHSDLRAALAKRGFGYERNRPTWMMLDSGHERNGFLDTSLVLNGPAIPPQLVAELLDTEPFKSMKNTVWRGGNYPVTAVTTPAGLFNIVPTGFNGVHVPTTDSSCMRCHQDAGKVVNRDGDARWRLRGADGIFTFHIFEPSSIGNPPLRLNEKLVRAGILVRRRF